MNFERKPRRFLCRGLNLATSVDAMPEGKYPRLLNVRSRKLGEIEPRDGIARVNITPATETNVHSIRRLNDPSPGAVPAWTRVVGAGTKLYTAQAFLTERDTGYSGDPLSLIPFRPERSPQAQMYVADRLRLRKIRADGLNVPMGIAPPLAAPNAELAPGPLYNVLSECDAVATWVNGGTAGAITAPARVTTTISRILFDQAAPAWACIEPTAIDEGIQPGMRLTIGGAAETVTIEEIHNPIPATTIGSIAYDSGVIGLCTIQPVNPTAGLARNSMVLVGAGGTIEPVRVLSVTEGPDGIYSFRCSTVNTQAAGGAIVGLPAFRVYCANNHAAAETLTTNCLHSTVTPGIGYLTLPGALNLAAISPTRPTQDEDEIHISISVDAPQNVVEAKLLLDVDSATNDFTQNYFFKALRANDLTPATRDTLTVSTTRDRAIQRELIDSYGYPQPEQLSGYVPELDVGGGQAGQIVLPAYRELPISEEAVTGALQWTELVFKVRDLERVGSDSSRGLANVASIRVMLNVIGTTIPRIDAWWLGGSYGPDAVSEANVGEIGQPYLYRYRYRASQTGAKSLPGPPTRHGLTPRRHRVMLTGVISGDPQVDKLDFERFGGNLNEWHYIGSSENSGTPQFNDDFPDDEIMGNLGLETDTYQPFPVVDLPKSGTCDVAGTKVLRVAGELFNTSWARGTQIKIEGRVYELYCQPPSTTVLETEQNVGTKVNVPWVVEQPLVLGQPLPVLWGPVPSENFFFGCGDDRNPGTIYATKGNDPDSAPDTHQLEVTGPSEPLMNGCVYDGKSLVASSERWFWVRRSQGPNVLEHQELPVGRGLFARWALAVGPKIWFLGKDGIYETAGGPATCITDADLYPLFPHEGVPGVAVEGYQPPDMTQTTRLRLAYADGWVIFDYQDTSGHQRTLVYDTRTGAWFPDVYTPAQLCHYEDEGSGLHNLISGGNDGRLYQAGGTADGMAPITCLVRTPADNAGDLRSRKHFGDFIADLDAAGVNVSVQAGFENYGTLLTATTINTSGRLQATIDVASGLGQLARNMGVEISWSSATATPRLYAWEPTLLPKPEDTGKRATDWIDLGGATFLQGLRINCDTTGVSRTVRVEYDGGILGDTLTVNHNGQQNKAYSFVVPFTANQIRLVPTDDGSWRFFGVEPIGEPAPDLARYWKTQVTTHDLSGFQHVRMAYIAHQATANLTLNVRCDGVDHNFTIAHNAGAWKKSRLDLPPIKGKLFEYSVTSTADFRLHKRDCEVWVKAWGDPGTYKIVNPFGGPSRADGARI